MSVFGMIDVDTENVYSEVVYQSEVDESPDDFFTKLAHEMIFNDIDRPASRRRRGVYRHFPGSYGTGTPPKHCVALTSSKNKRKNSDKHTFSVRFNIKGCRMKSTDVCWACTDENEDDEHYICSRRSVRDCWFKHLQLKHMINMTSDI